MMIESSLFYFLINNFCQGKGGGGRVYFGQKNQSPEERGKKGDVEAGW